MSGLNKSEIARRMGTTVQSLQQYLNGRRGNPGLLWFLKLAAVCNAKVTLERL